MAATEPKDRIADGYGLTELYKKRVRNNQDLFIIVSDWHNRRGTGKTIISLRIAHTFDRTDDGITNDKATLSVPQLMEAYTEQPKGSALLLDEAEAGVSKYEAGTMTNKAIRKLVSMGRIEEKYVIANLPNSGEMDSDLKALADVWVIVTSKGSAIANIMGWNPWGNHPVVAEQHPLEWGDIPKDHELRSVYEDLTTEKRRRLRGESGDENLVKESEVKERIESEVKEATREVRNDLLREFYERSDMTQQDVANAADLSRSYVGNILQGHSE